MSFFFCLQIFPHHFQMSPYIKHKHHTQTSALSLYRGLKKKTSEACELSSWLFLLQILGYMANKVGATWSVRKKYVRLLNWFVVESVHEEKSQHMNIFCAFALFRIYSSAHQTGIGDSILFLYILHTFLSLFFFSFFKESLRLIFHFTFPSNWEHASSLRSCAVGRWTLNICDVAVAFPRIWTGQPTSQPASQLAS